MNKIVLIVICISIVMSARVGAAQDDQCSFPHPADKRISVKSIVSPPVWYLDEFKKFEKAKRTKEHQEDQTAVSLDGKVVVTPRYGELRWHKASEPGRIELFKGVDPPLGVAAHTFPNPVADMSLTRDGRRVLFLDEDGMSESAPVFTGKLYWADLKSGELGLIKTGMVVVFLGHGVTSWNQDGSRVAFASAEQIFVYAITATRPVQVTGGEESNPRDTCAAYDLAWSKGGNQVIFKFSRDLYGKRTRYYVLDGINKILPK